MQEAQNISPLLRKLMANRTAAAVPPIDKVSANEFIDRLFTFLFMDLSEKRTAPALALEEKALKSALSDLVAGTGVDRERVRQQTETFFNALPAIYERLLGDARAIFEFDPAAVSKAEVVMSYPGFYATAIYRIAHQTYTQGIALLPRVFTEYGHGKTGIDIHPGAKIGDRFIIDHGTGIVIGETAVLGNDVSLFQGVTIGAIHVAKELLRTKRHPTLEDGVVVYSGATILGGETTIGRNSVIGGNAWLTRSVPAYSVVYQKSEVIIRDQNPLPEPINFVI